MDDSPIVTTKVLCLFRFEGKSEGRILWFRDSIMIEVGGADQIIPEFCRSVSLRRRSGCWIGPSPRRWELTGYLPERPFPVYH